MEQKKIDPAQYELFKYAQGRIKQKKILFLHFWAFILGSALMLIINKLLYSETGYNWYIWGIFLWLFLFLLHAVNVFVINRFMGKKWEENQRERLIALQQKRILQIETSLEKELQKEKEKLAKQQTNTSV